MAKSINLGKKPPVTPAPAVAPAAAPPPAMRVNGPPLPTGVPLSVGSDGVARPVSITLTSDEREAFEQQGLLKPGQPVPPNFAQILAAAQQEAQEEVMAAQQTLPVDPSTPPVTLRVEDPETAMRQAAAMGQAVLQPGPQAPAVARKVAASKSLDLGEPEAPERPAVSSVPIHDGPIPQAAPASAMESTVAHHTHCPHCNWDLALADIPEPPHEEKMAFVAAMLGEKPYAKTYDLMAGRLKITFRTLMPRELDACFKQVLVEQSRDEIKTVPDYWEKVNRYRLYLQLQRVEAPGAYDHEMPDGLSAWCSPHADAYWEFPEDEKEPLKLIDDHMNSVVLTSESIARIAQTYCGKFNRLVAKMEAMVEDSDFWKATGEQSSS